MTLHDFLEQSTATISSNKRAREVRRELLSHLQLKAAELEAGGVAASEAESDALRSLGDPAAIAQDYAVPEVRIKIGWAMLGAIPLFIAAAAALHSPSTILMWLVVLGTAAVIAEPGATLAARLSGLWRTLKNSPLILAAGAASGLAAALSTFGAGGPWSSLFEFFGPWLAVLYCCWQRSPERPAAPFSMVWITNAAFWAVGGSAFLLLGAASPRESYYYNAGSMVTVGLAVTISEWALAYAWEGIQWLRHHDTRISRARRTTLETASQEDFS